MKTNTVVGVRDFNWKKDNLYLNGKYVGKVIPDIESMWKIEFKDKELSSDYYNKTRAKDNLIKFLMKEHNSTIYQSQNDQETALGGPYVRLNQKDEGR